MRFNKNYFILTVILFIIEVCIALYAHDRIIRPYVGDLLVVILIYCFVRSFFGIPVLKLAIGVLLFAYLVEILQYLDIVNLLGLGNSNAARVIIGTHFEWIDILAYTIGIFIVILFERLNKKI